MNLGVIIQARMTSERLPGKVLRVVAGKPMLQYTVERLQHCAFDSLLVVATSREASDGPIAEFCEAHDVMCQRGPLLDVAGRFKEVVERNNMDAFVRICGDSPLLDPGVVTHAVGLFLEGGADLVTNIMPRTYPPGCSVEVVRSEAFLQACAEITSADEKEHVTKHLYASADRYRIANIAAADDFTGIRLCVDTEEDMDRFARIVARMDRPHWEYGLNEVIEIYRAVA